MTKLYNDVAVELASFPGPRPALSLAIQLAWFPDLRLALSLAIQLASFPDPHPALSLAIQKRRENPAFFLMWAQCNWKMVKMFRMNRQSLCLVQPTTHSTLGVYDSRPLLVRYVSFPVSLLSVFSWPSFTYAHFYRPFYLKVTHMGKDIRPSPLLFRTASDRKLGGAREQDYCTQHYIKLRQQLGGKWLGSKAKNVRILIH